MRIGILAGEASGDILGSRVIAALRSRYPDLQLAGIGGPLMEAQGLRSLFPMERLSVMGLVEPLRRLPELLRIRRAVFREFRDHPPDLFLGIDSPDFNLALERRLRRCGIRTAHLVSPSVWAWRAGRIRKIRRSVDLMLCLFPFETELYRRNGIPVQCVGHPLADEIGGGGERHTARAALGLPGSGPLLALLPGSRGREVRLLAPLFLQAARSLWQTHPGLSFVIPAANAARRAELEGLLLQYPELPVTLMDSRSREAMTAADAVLLASGTATLEAMLLRRPMVVAYRLSALTWLLLRPLLRTEFAALPNILAGRALVPELIQAAATPEALAATVEPLLTGGDAVREQRQAFEDIHARLRGDYAGRAAAALAALLTDHPEAGDGRSVPR